jgi:hypothetical protein
MPETKKCEVCDQEIGASEKTCPKCGVEFETLEEEVNVVSRAMTVAEKRRKAKEDAERPPEPPAPPAPPKKKSIFTSLSKGTR